MFVSPLVDDAALVNTKKLIADFEKGEGARLQEILLLQDKVNSDTSYITKPWLDMYLENRDPFPLFLSPQLTWKDDTDPKKMDQCARAANILCASARFFRSLRDDVLAPDIFHTQPEKSQTLWWEVLASLTPRAFSFYTAYAVGAYPLDMSQYANQFSATRHPRLGKDELAVYDDTDYVMVQRGAKFYKVVVLDKRGMPLDEAEVEAQLRSIVADKQSARDLPVGALTSLDRDRWAELRPVVEGASSANAQSFSAIDRALFTLTLEDSAPTSPADVSRCMLHGDCRNRWFDKSFSVIVCANGKAGVNWEHSWGDGVCMLRYFNEVFDEVTAEPAREPAAPAAGVAALKWDFNDAARKAVSEAEAKADALVDSAELEVYETDSLTKEDLKKQKLSPDGTMQMVLQLAHQRMHGYTPSTYESASTAAFKHGRTETIRSASPEAKAFALAFCDDSTDRDTRLGLLREAVDRHSKTTRDCMMGKGCDRHLFALRKLAEANGQRVPLFEDPAYAVFTDIRVSTSTLASPALDGGGFGPISPRAYSVGYGIEERGSRFHVMTNKLGTKEFVGHVEQALRDIRDAIHGSSA